MGEYGKYASLGISLVLTTAVYLFLGYQAGTWLDQRWGTERTFLLVGIVLGMVLSVVSLVKELFVLERSRGASARRGGRETHDRDSEKNNFPLDARSSGREPPSKSKDEG